MAAHRRISPGLQILRLRAGPICGARTRLALPKKIVKPRPTLDRSHAKPKSSNLVLVTLGSAVLGTRQQILSLF
jgi:hypothetical protein